MLLTSLSNEWMQRQHSGKADHETMEGHNDETSDLDQKIIQVQPNDKLGDSHMKVR